MSANEIVDAIEICRRRLRAQGLDVEQTSRFDEVEPIFSDLGKPYLTRQLDPRSNDFHASNSFWLKIVRCGGDQEGRGGDEATVGVSGARLDTLPPGAFPRFFRSHLQRLFSSERTEEIVHEQRFPPEIQTMSGNVVYLGDFFTHPDIRGAKFDKGAYTMLIYLFAMLEWRFDWLYLFVTREHALRGYLSRYNMPISYPASVLWDKPPAERSDADYLGIMPEASFIWMVRRLLLRPDLFGE